MAKKTSLEELYAYLATFHLSDGLYQIGMINAAMKYRFEHLSTDGISYPVIKWLNKWLCSNVLFSHDYLSLSKNVVRLS